MKSSNTIKQARFNDFVLLSFFPIVMIYMLLQFSGYRFPIIGIYLRIALLYSAIVSFKYVRRGIVLEFLLIYIAYCLISVVSVWDNSVELEGYSYDVLNYLLPMLAFFLGSNTNNNDNQYYRWFLYSVLFCFGLGLIFYFFSYDWYVEKVSNRYSDRIGTELSSLDHLHEKTRFSSFMYTSYPIQYFGISALSYLLFLIYKHEGSLKTGIFYAVSLMVILLSIILCQQRAAWGYMAVLLAFYMFIASGRKGRIWKSVLGGVLILLAMGIFMSNSGTIKEVLSLRLSEMSFSTAMSGREDQYQSLWSNWTNPFLGQGMGSGGAIARIAGLPGASDANYMKILYENGVVGAFLFLGIILPTLMRVFKNAKRYYVELHIIVFFLFAMIGSNSLCISIYYSVIFWFAIGRVWNNNYIINTVEISKK